MDAVQAELVRKLLLRAVECRRQTQRYAGSRSAKGACVRVSLVEVVLDVVVASIKDVEE